MDQVMVSKLNPASFLMKYVFYTKVYKALYWKLANVPALSCRHLKPIAIYAYLVCYAYTCYAYTYCDYLVFYTYPVCFAYLVCYAYPAI